MSKSPIGPYPRLAAAVDEWDPRCVEVAGRVAGLVAERVDRATEETELGPLGGLASKLPETTVGFRLAGAVPPHCAGGHAPPTRARPTPDAPPSPPCAGCASGRAASPAGAASSTPAI